MNIDGVFSGGGIKAYAYIGALDAIQEKNLSFERLAGTSAGALIASLLAAGFQTEELKKELLETDMTSFLDSPKWSKLIPFSKLIRIYFQMGMYKGDALENWIARLLAKKNVHTFSDIQQGYLKIVVSDISLRKMIVFPDDLERVYGIDPDSISIATAVRMSAGFPYFFMPKKMAYRSHRKSMMVDGGILSNFPLWLFERKKSVQTRPVLGVRLSGDSDDEKKIKNALEMFQGLFSTMKLAHDSRYVSTDEKHNIVNIPIEEINPIDFSRTRKQNNQLIETGYEETKSFLNNWPR